MTSGTQPADLPPSTPCVPADLPEFPVFIEPPDLAPFIDGNTGVAGFWARDSGRPGPHVLLVSLIHGNELAGATVLAALLREQFMPLRGKLTLGFANLAAFARFDASNPVASRFVEEDMNRVWDDAQLFGVRQSLELDRARQLRPLIDTADILLDLHSMLWPSDPLLLCGPSPRGRELAEQLATPALIVADCGHAGGKRLIDYAHFTSSTGKAAGILVEAGQHWEPGAIAQTEATVRALLFHAGMLEGSHRTQAARLAAVECAITARTNRFVFTRPFRGGEVIGQAGTVIAHDGETEIRTPFDHCLLVMPSLRVSLGHTAVRLARLK